MSALGVRALTEGWVRIPRKFYDDHWARDLPTPVEQHGTKQWAWIKRNDPAIGELICDAKYYASTGGPDGWGASAKALLKALGVKYSVHG